jgi:hypothetical protein
VPHAARRAPRAGARLADPVARRHARAVSRILLPLVALAALGFGGWWLLGQGPRGARPDAVPADPAPTQRDAAPQRAPLPATFGTPPASATANLQTPLGDTLFRWRCTTGLREALAGHPDWPLRRVAGFCLCVADRMRQDGLREVPAFRGEGLAAALATAEAGLCRPS